jgi:hypothetical protein
MMQSVPLWQNVTSKASCYGQCLDCVECSEPERRVDTSTYRSLFVGRDVGQGTVNDAHPYAPFHPRDAVRRDGFFPGLPRLSSESPGEMIPRWVRQVRPDVRIKILKSLVRNGSSFCSLSTVTCSWFLVLGSRSSRVISCSAGGLHTRKKPTKVT